MDAELRAAKDLIVHQASEIKRLKADYAAIITSRDKEWNKHQSALAECERLRAALKEAEIYFGDEWPDKIRAMTRMTNEQITK